MLKRKIICYMKKCYSRKVHATARYFDKFLESVSWSNTHRPPFPESVYVAMSDQQGQRTHCGEKSEINVVQWGDLQGDFQSQNHSDDLQESHQNQVQTCDKLKPLGNCCWVDCAEQVQLDNYAFISSARSYSNYSMTRL